jgi:dGTPase
LVIAEELEMRYPDFPGLNLTHELLESQGARGGDRTVGLAPLLEAQVVDVADNITYDAHDTDDAVKLGLVTLDELSENALLRDTANHVRQRFGTLTGKMLRMAIVHELIDRQVSDVLQIVGPRLAASDLDSAESARRCGIRIGPSGELATHKLELESFLYQRVYRHPQLIRLRDAAQHRLRTMFHNYLRHPEYLPEKFQVRAAEIGLPRSVGDYLAGMTDRFCDEQYRRHFASDGG